MHEHKWVNPSEIQTPGCGYCNGDNAVQEVIVFASIPVRPPQPGDICFNCGQINGQPKGIIDPEFSRLKELLASHK